MKKIICVVVNIFISGLLLAQPTIEWSKCYGGRSDDNAYTVIAGIGGGYIIAGETYSNNGDIIDNHGRTDFWVVKLNDYGDIEWQKCLGGGMKDAAYSITKYIDSSYIVAGTTKSTDGNVSGKHIGADTADAWLVKLGVKGELKWQKCIGGSGGDYAISIIASNDSGIIFTGLTSSNDGDVTGNHGGSDIWVVKLNGSGDIVWQKCFGGKKDDRANSIIKSGDGGYIIAGYTFSQDGDITGKHNGTDCADFWIIKITEEGEMVWQKCLGGSSWDRAYSIIAGTDGGYIVTGYAESKDGDVIGNHGGWDTWVIKLTEIGDVEWQKCLGGSGNDVAYSVLGTSDGGYILAGSTRSANGDVSGNHGVADFWLVKLNGIGDIEWQKCLGGSGYDEAYSIVEGINGGYIVAGLSHSKDDDVTDNHGGSDFWVVKFNTTVDILDEASFSISILPNPVDNLLNIEITSTIFSDAQINIYDLNGNEVILEISKMINIGSNSLQIDCQKLPCGAYTLVIETQTQRIVEHFVVQR